MKGSVKERFSLVVVVNKISSCIADWGAEVAERIDQSIEGIDSAVHQLEEKDGLGGQLMN